MDSDTIGGINPISAEEIEREWAMRYYRIAGVPERYHRLTTLKDVRAACAAETVEEFKRFGQQWILPARNQEFFDVKNVYLYGPNDVGKTTLACLAMLALCRYLRDLPDPIFLHCGTYIASMRRSDGVGQRKFDRALASSVMVLDDIGSEYKTLFSMEQLNNLLDGRLGCGFPNIFTSNLSPKELEGHLDRRTATRMLRGCEIVELL